MKPGCERRALYFEAARLAAIAFSGSITHRNYVNPHNDTHMAVAFVSRADSNLAP
jgi:hypothetical protein